MKIRQSGRQFQSGLTLVEILMVVLIIGIASTVAITMLGSSGDLQVRAAARALVADLLYAQTRAISMQQPCKVVFDTTHQSYELQDAAGHVIADPAHPAPAGADPNDYNYQVFLGAGSRYSKVNLSQVNFNGTSTVWFDDMGAPYGGDNNPLTSGTAQLTADALQIQVHVEPVTGRINLTEP